MPFKIDRVPQGLLNLLATRGGGTPAELEDRVRSVIDLTQMYGLQQVNTFLFNDPALAEGGTASILQGVASGLGSRWCVLFGASFGGLKTGTMTAFRCGIEMIRGGANNSITLAQDELGPFGATETGAAGVVFWAPYPILLSPPWNIFGRVQILGTDATANCTCIAHIGVLQ